MAKGQAILLTGNDDNVASFRRRSVNLTNKNGVAADNRLDESDIPANRKSTDISLPLGNKGFVEEYEVMPGHLYC